MGGKSQEQPKQSTTYELAPEQRELMNLAMPGIRNFAAQTPERYQGSTIAPFNPTQQRAQTTALSAADQQKTVADKMTQLALGVPGSLTDFKRSPLSTSGDFNITPEQWSAATPTLNASIKAATNPIYEQLTEAALPAIRGTGLGTTGLTTSGTRQGVAEGIATGKASRAAGDVGARMADETYRNLLNLNQQRYATNLGAENQRYATDVGAEGQRYGQNLSALYQTLGLTPMLQGAQTAPAATIGAVGDVNQAYDQAKINEAMQNFNFDQYGGYLQSKDIMSLLQGIPGGTTTSTANVPKANPWMQAVGGASTGASIGSTFGPWGTAAGAAGGALMPFLFA